MGDRSQFTTGKGAQYLAELTWEQIAEEERGVARAMAISDLLEFGIQPQVRLNPDKHKQFMAEAPKGDVSAACTEEGWELVGPGGLPYFLPASGEWVSLRADYAMGFYARTFEEPGLGAPSTVDVLRATATGGHIPSADRTPGFPGLFEFRMPPRRLTVARS